MTSSERPTTIINRECSVQASRTETRKHLLLERVRITTGDSRVVKLPPCSTFPIVTEDDVMPSYHKNKVEGDRRYQQRSHLGGKSRMKARIAEVHRDSSLRMRKQGYERLREKKEVTKNLHTR